MTNYDKKVDSVLCDTFEITTGVSPVYYGFASVGSIPAIQIVMSKNGNGQVVSFAADMLPELIEALNSLPLPSAEVVANGKLATAKQIALETLSACASGVKDDTRNQVRASTSVAQVVMTCANPQVKWDSAQDYEKLYRKLQVLA